MKKIALLYFMGDSNKTCENNSSGIISIIFKWIFLPSLLGKLRKLIKIKLVIGKEIQVDSSFVIQGIKLPYTLEEFNKLGRAKRNRLEKIISKICSENSITKCIKPASCSCSLKSCEKSKFDGKIVYTALAEYILNDLCEKKAFSIRDIDIAVIQGEDDLLPYLIIKLLSPVVKFITLVTGQKEVMERKIEEICDETGLSVRITDNLKDVLKNSDLIINYGNIKISGIKNSIDLNSIIINYGELEDLVPEIKKIVICGIDIGLTDKYLQAFEKEIFKFYSSTEIAEIVLTNKTDEKIDNLHNFLDFKAIEKIKEYFREEGFYVKGYL